MHISIFSFLYKEGVFLKIECSRMLQNQISVGENKLFFKYFVGNSIKPFYGIWRICKDYIKFFCALQEEFEWDRSLKFNSWLNFIAEEEIAFCARLCYNDSRKKIGRTFA